MPATINETPKKDTDPYCPSVRAMPSDDIPLIVKGSKEFPAWHRRSHLISQVEAKAAGQEKASGKLT